MWYSNRAYICLNTSLNHRALPWVFWKHEGSMSKGIIKYELVGDVNALYNLYLLHLYNVCGSMVIIVNKVVHSLEDTMIYHKVITDHQTKT